MPISGYEEAMRAFDDAAKELKDRINKNRNETLNLLKLLRFLSELEKEMQKGSD